MINRGKWVISSFILIIFIFSLHIASAAYSDEIKNEIEKLSNFAEDYESGNINYMQLFVYTAETEQNINLQLRKFYKENKRPMNAQEIESIVGKPQGSAREVWNMWKQKLDRLEEPFPTWNKAFYDGKDIQIRVKVEPDMGMKSGEVFLGPIFKIETKFKLDDFEVDTGALSEITEMLKRYDASMDDELAKEIAEKASDYSNSMRDALRISGGCENNMKRMLGGAYGGERKEVKSYIYTISRGDQEMAGAFFQYCDKCDEVGRIEVKFYKEENGQDEAKEFSKDQFKGLTDEEYEKQINEGFIQFQQNPDNEIGSKMNSLVNAWMWGMDYQSSFEERVQRYHRIKSFLTDILDEYPKEEKTMYQIEYKRELAFSEKIIDIPQTQPECKKYEDIDCSGKVIFKGEDANGCPLGPICITNEDKCTLDSDCESRLCGQSKCIEGECKVVELNECQQSECNEGDKDYAKCKTGEVIVRKLCYEGRWKETGEGCTEFADQIPQVEEQNQEEQDNNEVESEPECSSISDCSSGEVCSNGECVALPEKDEEEQIQIPEEEPQTIESADKEDSGDKEESKGITGNIIRSLTNMVGRVIDSGEEEKTEEEVKDEGQIEEEKKDAQKEYGNFGAVYVMGRCWVGDEQNGDSGDMWFNFEGKYGKIGEMMKQYKGYEDNWCSQELKNAIVIRKEIEKSFNDDFAQWFFEDYLTKDMDKWLIRTDILNKIYNENQKNAEIIAGDTGCASNIKIPEFELIKINYNTNYGSLEYWEKIMQAKAFRSKGKVDVISPFMTEWIWPPKEFLKRSLIANPDSMDSPDQPYREGMLEEKDQLRSSQKIVNKVENMINKYGKGKDYTTVNLRFIDYTDNTAVIDMLINVDKKDILSVSPNKGTTGDITVDSDFNELYDFMELIQKENKESLVKHPEWDKSIKVKDVYNNVKNTVKVIWGVRKMVSSVEVNPEEAKSDIVDFGISFLTDQMEKDKSS